MDPTHFLSAPGLAWEACLEKTGIKLKLITDVNILLIVEKGIRGGICHAIHKYAKANNKYMKNDNKNKESSYIQYLVKTICMDGKCLKKYLTWFWMGERYIKY